MSSIQTAYNIIIEKCNQANVRYSQQYRQGQIVDGYEYYDCSSLISYALTRAGFFSENPWFTTYNMISLLRNIGFTVLNINNEWQNGDIVVSETHTEMVYDGANKILMGAHTDQNPPAEQVSIRKYPASVEEFTTLLRHRQSNWLAKEKDGYFPASAEENNNAWCIYNILINLGWSVNAISAVCGNMRHESGLNPWRWQNDDIVYPDNDSRTHGYGLVQFTPSGKYILDTYAQTLQGFNPNYLGHRGSPSDGNAQILFINNKGAENWVTGRIPEQWKMTFEQFKNSTQSPYFLAISWLWGYEFPGDIESQYEIRGNSANYFYQLFQGEPPEPPPPPPPPTPPQPILRKSKFKLIYYIKSWRT